MVAGKQKRCVCLLLILFLRPINGKKKITKPRARSQQFAIRWLASRTPLHNNSQPTKQQQPTKPKAKILHWNHQFAICCCHCQRHCHTEGPASGCWCTVHTHIPSTWNDNPAGGACGVSTLVRTRVQIVQDNINANRCTKLATIRSHKKRQRIKNLNGDDKKKRASEEQQKIRGKRERLKIWTLWP